MKDSVPSAESHPHTFAWYILVKRFHESVRSTWAGAGGAGKGGKPAPKQEAKKEKPKEDDDDFDPFGDQDEVSI